MQVNFQSTRAASLQQTVGISAQTTTCHSVSKWSFQLHKKWQRFFFKKKNQTTTEIPTVAKTVRYQNMKPSLLW